ncbi:putative leucine-rich repeat receptor-like serine/threonine-protein kinase [Morus notabilis]|uniref:non-specific serine/threonine protein kinase n=1 Tax=Morus notabilis TaxID=981085 RepID=W9SAP9_9ROSA|nr:putative leucine-rich repeat receptor-like serine/threonine-protein kinase [Morus notabilis]
MLFAKQWWFLLLFITLWSCNGVLLTHAQVLHADEVEALKEIAKEVGKKDWNFSINPCSKDKIWITPMPDGMPLYNNTVNCNCSNGICHVIHLFLKGQDLDGVLPPSLAKLPYLQQVDFTRNYLHGNIPREWATMKHLEYLSLESNMFSGPVPPELGNLVNLVNLILNSNNLTGSLPSALFSLSKLKELEIQASGFEGPIPSSISVLSNLTQLRISDLNGAQRSNFPSLRKMTNLSRLMLRSCNLYGNIPPFISQLRQLQKLDLSFNRLEGHIPDLKYLERLEKICLTSNLLSDPFPEWIQTRLDTKLSLAKCLSNTCTQDYYSLHINCGGKETTIGKLKYEEDQNQGGEAKFKPEKYGRWDKSTTGEFLDVGTNQTIDYIAKNVSTLRMKNSELYTQGSLSALSLTYFARCLANGNYTVKLHFAEIIIRDNRSFQSLGRRLFDVYIQEKLVLKDFNIEKEAGGVDKVVIKEFNKIKVKNKILEIRFHWSGKGTTSAPKRGTYGPLISAISMDSEFKPPEEKKKISIAIGAVISGLGLIFAIISLLWWKGFFGGSISREKELRGLDLQTGFFTFRQIKAATNNFDPINKIGEGGFGSVFKGILLDGSIIAVKQLSSKSRQGNREFVNEIGMISGLHHPNLVRLYGCCIEGNQLFLVYEYMENNSLARALFGPDDGRLNLDWPTRHKICVGIAKGLAFLHEESTLRVVHRDIKTTNILLDKDLNPKISDFGLAKLDEEENTHISTRIAGTIGYMAPEYALWGYLTYKADVFSFAVVALEILAGTSNMKYRPNENYVCLVDWALVLQQQGNLMELVDPNLGSDFNKEEAVRMIKIAILCTNQSPALRPIMSAVVSMLEGRTAVHDLIMDPSIYGDELRFTALRKQFDQMAQRSLTESQSLVQSAQDLYEVNPESVTISSHDLYNVNPESVNNSSISSLTSKHSS